MYVHVDMNLNFYTVSQKKYCRLLQINAYNFKVGIKSVLSINGDLFNPLQTTESNILLLYVNIFHSLKPYMKMKLV
jgi:hypothetical protein